MTIVNLCLSLNIAVPESLCTGACTKTLFIVYNYSVIIIAEA